MKAIISGIVLAVAMVFPASAQQVDRLQNEKADSLQGQVWAMSLVQEQLIKLAWGTNHPEVVKAVVRGARDTYDRVIKTQELLRQHPDIAVHINQGADDYFDRLDSLIQILEDATKGSGRQQHGR